MANSARKKKKKKEVTIETIQKEYSPVLRKKKTDIYIASNKPINIYYQQILKTLNSKTKKVEHLIEGDIKKANSCAIPSNDQICIYAVGTNILRASYLVQDIVNFYYNFLHNIRNGANVNVPNVNSAYVNVPNVNSAYVNVPNVNSANVNSANVNSANVNSANVNISNKGKRKKSVDVTSHIDIKVNSKTLLMNDNVITNKFSIKEDFSDDDYADVINFAKQPYNPTLHKYIERSKERRVTVVAISIKKKSGS
ncbi:conserved Plasmodium protein, unknown function [Plasmodium malariae]|uniref:DNA/RNA-binding protein Alba-like domain-containing protein n=1 Tax=Plasmodium malariae TaxID=5858 RepID=A0A1D3JJ13_PLAMA|nr:conserved Plasmodium protein, unknown function [Plasmodium malariae]SBT86467.1 conserved Plasmodium protein, unknown function [Plasmodium malariae]